MRSANGLLKMKYVCMKITMYVPIYVDEGAYQSLAATLIIDDFLVSFFCFLYFFNGQFVVFYVRHTPSIRRM